MLLPAKDNILAGFMLLFLSTFYTHSTVSLSVKIQSFLAISTLVSYCLRPRIWESAICHLLTFSRQQPLLTTTILVISTRAFICFQQKLRYSRLNAIRTKYGFTNDPASWEDMTVEQAQEIENNIGEWEFPRLWEFAWISDFIRTATDPGVSRALIAGGHMINADSFIEHERLQATIHAMRGFLSYKIGSPEHSLIVSRINEHHHRYGIYINSDDILYLIIHFAFSPIDWVNKFGYRQLEAFEVHAVWVVWREIGCRMGCKYIPQTVEQAKEWRKTFEKTCRWREDANEIAAMAMLNEIIYSVPSALKPFARRVFASIVESDIIYYCQLEKLGPSSRLRSFAYTIFALCAWLINVLGFPRMSAYRRRPEGPNKQGLMNFGHTPYDTLPFYQERSFWNLFGYRAILRRLRNLPLPSPKYQSGGTALEALGAHQISPEAQATTQRKVRENAAAMENGGFGYRPAIGWMNGRLVGPVKGPSYGSPLNMFPNSTPLIPPVQRFEKAFRRRGPGYSKIDVVETPEEVIAFDRDEYADAKINDVDSNAVM